jgi:very-short-patch-repair endonuclease
MKLATRQRGVVSAQQLRKLGYSRNSVARAAKAGRLYRVHRGVYAVGHRRLDWHGHCMAAVLGCAPAVAGYSSAAYIWGFLRRSPSRIHLVAPTERHHKPWCTVHCARLLDADITIHDDIPVTTVARTLLDQAATLSDERVGRMLERAEELELFDLRAIDALLARAGKHPGIGRLRRMLSIYKDDPAFVRSRLERRFLTLVRKSGLPIPATNLNVDGYELDAYWEAERFAVELDVFETHGTRAAFERDRLRQEELKLLGIEMIRVTGSRLDRAPRVVVERVAALLAQRRKQLA